MIGAFKNKKGNEKNQKKKIIGEKQ